MRETQLEAWEKIQESLPLARSKILYVIKAQRDNGATLFELSAALGWPINRVSGRVTELTKVVAIKDSGLRRVNPESGKRGIVWI